jgi:hypothetical protein
MFPEDHCLFPEGHCLFPEGHCLFPEGHCLFPEWQVLKTLEKNACIPDDQLANTSAAEDLKAASHGVLEIAWRNDVHIRPVGFFWGFFLGCFRDGILYEGFEGSRFF